MAKKKITTAQNVLEAYMDYVLENQAQPKNVYVFAKHMGITEAEFYGFFSSFSAIENNVFEVFFSNVHALLESDEAFSTYDAKNKLLSFYYTFFETLTANRSFVLFALTENKNKLEAAKTLSGLHKKFKAFVSDLDIESFDLMQAQLEKMKDAALAEIAWGQFLLTLKFWMDDTSPNFEKTDLYIEKSINASFELLKIKPLDSLIDFGKFLFKEKVAPKN